MKRSWMFLPLALFLFHAGNSFAAADKTASNREKFYGRIISVNPAEKSLVVQNKKRKMDATFRWDGETSVTANKQEARAADLKEGQWLAISFVTEGDMRLAKRIQVRPTPFQKKTAEPQATE